MKFLRKYNFYGDLKQNENFDFDDDDFDFEEEEFENGDDYIHEFLNPSGFIYNHNGDEIGNVRIEVTPETWNLFVDEINKHDKNIRWVTGLKLSYLNLNNLKNDFPGRSFSSFYIMVKYSSGRLYFRVKGEEGGIEDTMKTYKM